MTPQLIIAGCTLLIFWTVTVLGGATWLQNQLKSVKTEILSDFDKKHNANNIRIEAMNELLIRHDVLLNPEFTSRPNGQRHHG